MNDEFELILAELNAMRASVSDEDYNTFVRTVADYKRGKVVGIGAGRMGYALRGFIMRLCHMGFDATMIGDTSVPRVDEDTLVIVNSSSGSTPTCVLYAEQARGEGSTVFTLTSNADSPLATIFSSDSLVYTAPSPSRQIMKTACEQFTGILLDEVAADVRRRLGQDDELVSKNHSVLE